MPTVSSSSTMSHVGGASPVMSARTVALSVALSLLVLLPSLFAHDDSWTFYSPSDRYPVAANGPPGQSKRGGANPPGHNKWGVAGKGPPGGRGPPGLAGGSPPGLHGKHPPGWNKVDEISSEGENLPDPDRESIHTPRPNNSGNDNDNRGPAGPDGYVPDSNRFPQNRQCRDGEFRCRNNECVPQSARCDNKADCRDSSDEELCFANRNQENGCVLPEPPEGGHYQLRGCESRHCTKRPGDTVPLNSILTYSCKDNYVLSGNTISVCVNNEWYEPPSCHKVCPPLNSTTVDITCSYQGETASCSERVLPGTRAALACKSSYKLPLTNDPAYREITCLEDGLWDQRVFRCLPECGTSIAHGNTLVVNGFQAKVGAFPWHVGIYGKKRMNQYEQICGGTLISNNLVVSAAHCFYDEVYNKPKDASDYAVAAGKHYRDWDTKEEYTQKSMVDSIRLGGRYMGARGNFAEDIALLKLKTPFELTTLVRPVCMDWDNLYEREQLQTGQAGKVVGWGKDIKGESTTSLQEIAMPFVPYQQCLSAVPFDFRGFITSDKFCAGHLNGSSVCEGDSGGGLSFEKNGLWYLRGIVSVSPVKGGSCDYNSYVGFTSISHFRDWIREAYVSDT
ncbi:Limulus clotting factor C [Ooceraea biroi]|uniref:Limulus clotting factor C n=1 Tax=Ooceraea biroi TaxID=2015173 RepID=A0A026WJM0_OOCBI|nr:Limulus clotting factor C [Ooceraea biroi]